MLDRLVLLVLVVGLSRKSIINRVRDPTYIDAWQLGT